MTSILSLFSLLLKYGLCGGRVHINADALVLCKPKQMQKLLLSHVQDLVRMADARMAQTMRQQVERQSGSATLAGRMVPQAAHEAKYAGISARLEALLVPPPQRDDATPVVHMIERGIPNLAKVQAAVQDTIARLQAQLPYLQSLASNPVMQQMVMEITGKVMQRAAARSVKFAFASAGRSTPQR